MELGKTLYVTNRKQWRAWLAKNHDREKVIWLVYYRKSSGRARLPYNDSVEEALCYGWIDSIVKRIDDEKFCQRFTLRRPKSRLSEMNKERIRRLIANKRMTTAGLNAVRHAFDKNQKFTIAPDILKALKADARAWKHFQSFPEGYKKVRLGYIESRRRHGKGAFQKSLLYFIKMTAENKKFGMVQ
jgi:uncharacterized protein YdeI (YjbR/CyaY-like superfamily)